MNRSLITLLFWALATVSWCDEAMPCSSVVECDCGEVCVDEDDKRCDDDDFGCACRPGCTVFDTYIRPGVTETVYGNRCHCPHTIEHVVKDLERTAACTKAMWFGQPLGMRPYERNPKCYADEI